MTLSSSSPRSVSSSRSSSTFEFDNYNSINNTSITGTTSPNSNRYNPELKRLNELSRRGLVMKSPFFQMAEEGTLTTSTSTPGSDRGSSPSPSTRSLSPQLSYSPTNYAYNPQKV